MENEIANIKSLLEKHDQEIDELRMDRVELRSILERLDKTVASLEATVKKIEMKPANNWEKFVPMLGYSAIAAILMYGVCKIFGL